MNGPQHYREAERILETTLAPETRASKDSILANAAVAQVHATLALVAATAYPAVVAYCGAESGDEREWTQATS